MGEMKGLLIEDRVQAYGLRTTAPDRDPLAEVRGELERLKSLRMLGRLTPSQEARFFELLARESELMRNADEVRPGIVLGRDNAVNDRSSDGAFPAGA